MEELREFVSRFVKVETVLYNSILRQVIIKTEKFTLVVGNEEFSMINESAFNKIRLKNLIKIVEMCKDIIRGGKC